MQWKKKLQSARKRWKTFDLSKSALVVVDMQKYFLDESSHAFVPSSTSILPNVIEIVQTYRKADRPVAFTYFAVKEGEPDPIGEWWGRSVKEGEDASKIVKELQPLEEDLVMRKSSYSSFKDTDLEEFMKKKDVENLVITGVLTNICCETAAREAFSLGYDVFIPIDATASYNEEMHVSSLITLCYAFATPLSTQEILKSS